MDPFWNGRWSEAPPAYGDQPNVFLAAHVAAVPVAGEIVCLADGDGRNGGWLAGRGFSVTGVDSSEVAVARANARGCNGYHAICADLRDWPFPPCDAIVSIYAHFPPSVRAAVHARAWASLRPGGVFLLEGFSPAQVLLERTSGGPKDVAMLFTAAMLRGDLPGAVFEVIEETTTSLSEGPYHVGPAEVFRVLAQKPH